MVIVDEIAEIDRALRRESGALSREVRRDLTRAARTRLRAADGPSDDRRRRRRRRGALAPARTPAAGIAPREVPRPRRPRSSTTSARAATTRFVAYTRRFDDPAATVATLARRRPVAQARARARAAERSRPVSTSRANGSRDFHERQKPADLRYRDADGTEYALPRAAAAQRRRVRARRHARRCRRRCS